MTLNNFAGGLNTKLHPSLIPPNQGVIYKNIDHTKGILTPLKEDGYVEPSPAKYWTLYERNNTVIAYDNIGSFVRFRDYLYFFGSTQEKTDPQNNKYPIGIPYPTTAPNIASTSTEEGEHNFGGKVKYCYTFYDPVTGLESVPSPLTEEIDLPDGENDYNSVTLDSFEETNYKIRLYRVDSYMIDFNLVDEFDYQDSYTDTKASIAIAGDHILDSYSNYPPPANLRYATETNGIVLGAIDNKLYFSKTGFPDYFPKENYIEFEEEITGIGVTQHGILVFLAYKTYIIVGTSSKTFTKYLLNGNIGCLNHYTIAYVNNGLIWYSNKGVVWSNGGNIELISYPLLGEIVLTTINAIALNRQYILLSQEKILYFDFRENLIIQEIDQINGSDLWLGVYKGDLAYCSYDGSIWKIFKFFKGFNNRTMHFKSGIHTLGEYTRLKTFKDFYILYKDFITLTLYVDGIKVFDRELQTNRIEFENIKTLNSYDGYGLEIEIVGNGEVYEIEYKAKGRDKP